MATTPTIKELLGKGFLPKICKAAGTSSYSYASQVVATENHKATTIWPAVLEVAEKNNPAGFAEWAAANPDKVPAKVAA